MKAASSRTAAALFLAASVAAATSEPTGTCDSGAGSCGEATEYASYSYQGLNLQGQTVLVTGASAGIGAATAKRFAAAGCKVVLVARRQAKLEAVRAEILQTLPDAQVAVLTLDCNDLAAVQALPARLPEGFGEVDILVNNAGLALGTNKVYSNEMDEIQKMLTVNVAALMALSQLFTEGMVARSRGHLINIGSIAGHEAYGGGSVYCATKHAVDAFTKAARHDLMDTPVRVTSISPGAVNTEFSTVRFGGDKGKADSVYDGFNPLLANDIADNVLYAATRPLNVQVADIIVLANAQAGPKDISRLGTH